MHCEVSCSWFVYVLPFYYKYGRFLNEKIYDTAYALDWQSEQL